MVYFFSFQKKTKRKTYVHVYITNRWKRRFAFHTPQMRKSCCYRVIKVVYRQVMFTWFFSHKYSWNCPIVIIDYEWICILSTSVNAQTKWRLSNNTAGQADLQHHCCFFAAAKVSPIWTPNTNIKGSRLYDDDDNNHKNRDNNHDALDWNQDSNVKTDRKHTDPPLTVKSEAVSRRG